jgi:hypothetical protein
MALVPASYRIFASSNFVIENKNSVIVSSVVTGNIAVDALSGLYRSFRYEGTAFPFAELRREFYPSCTVAKSKGPTTGRTPLALLALLQFALPLLLTFAKLAAETTNKGCPNVFTVLDLQRLVPLL